MDTYIGNNDKIVARPNVARISVTESKKQNQRGRP